MRLLPVFVATRAPLMSWLGSLMLLPVATSRVPVGLFLFALLSQSLMPVCHQLFQWTLLVVQAMVLVLIRNAGYL